jgi:DNA-binding NarL/FixJ family response regulator
MVLVALADNCPLIRRALKDLLGKRAQYQLVWHATTPDDLLQSLARKRPHVLVLEPALSGGGGLHLIEKLRGQYPRLQLLIYTSCASQDVAVSSMQLGAAGFLTKDSPEEELVAAIQKISNGGVYITPALMEHIALLHLSAGNSQKPAISPREQQVLEGLAAGLQLKAIARKISRSAKTVSTHRARLLLKLGLHSNAELWRYSQNSPLLHSSPSPSPRPSR